MGTKSNPGKYDCYNAAKPDEPIFILLGRDPAAYLTIKFWIVLRRAIYPNEPKTDEAENCVNEMKKYCMDSDRAIYARQLWSLFKGIAFPAHEHKIFRE